MNKIRTHQNTKPVKRRKTMFSIIIEQLLIKRAELAAAYKVAPSQAIALEFMDVQRALNAAYCKRHTILNRNTTTSKEA